MGGERHDNSGAGVDELAGSDKVVVGVWENDEVFLDEGASGFNELLGVGKKSLLIADDFELDPIRKADFAAKVRGANGFIGCVAGCGVRQDKDFFAVDVTPAAIPSICR